MSCTKEIAFISVGRILGTIAATRPPNDISLQKTIISGARHSLSECEAQP
jgi:hypothetical protein